MTLEIGKPAGGRIGVDAYGRRVVACSFCDRGCDGSMITPGGPYVCSAWCRTAFAESARLREHDQAFEDMKAEISRLNASLELGHMAQAGVEGRLHALIAAVLNDEPKVKEAAKAAQMEYADEQKRGEYLGAVELARSLQFKVLQQQNRMDQMQSMLDSWKANMVEIGKALGSDHPDGPSLKTVETNNLALAKSLIGAAKRFFFKHGRLADLADAEDLLAELKHEAG
jgi:hypothetical protein